MEVPKGLDAATEALRECLQACAEAGTEHEGRLHWRRAKALNVLRNELETERAAWVEPARATL